MVRPLSVLLVRFAVAASSSLAAAAVAAVGLAVVVREVATTMLAGDVAADF